MNIIESIKLTDIIVILGYLGTALTILVSMKERQKKDAEAIRSITECLDSKADKTAIMEQRETNHRIFDALDTKESKEDAQEWREQMRHDSDEIKLAVRDIGQKIDKYLVNGNGRKP